ncbi:hypothetical protein L6452_17188 [Arctium lappa]|uniref:Uncharacterized protein n=1 Tax=Arctium lappa TaxID=4217 RepID=A0ACB9C2K2_ARCLA|nr:hypothetical protein L6452_17188 [Arctium lappa]
MKKGKRDAQEIIEKKVVSSKKQKMVNGGKKKVETKTQKKNAKSSSESEEEQKKVVVASKKAAPVVKKPVKESESEDEAPKKQPPKIGSAVAPAKKVESSEESDSDEEVKQRVSAPPRPYKGRVQKPDKLDGANSIKKGKKVARKKKREGAELPEAETTETVSRGDIYEEGKNSSAGTSNKKKNKSEKKKRTKENMKVDGVRSNEVRDDSNQQSGKSKAASQLKNDTSLLDDEDEVYQISSGDEDETTGMKRWIAEYDRARPGAEVLLQQIDDFLVDYWEQKEKERKEREAEAAEGGWTVVKHIKGRKKTTDGESGTTMGSVAQAAVIDKMSKKKKDKQHVVGLNFYRFQRREAQRNEIMMLQTKFEQDKKRIQQMRAARKFRPY